ncbi:MAG: SDR family oxidoreductase, partial [Gemmatimonadaceae bacterium]
MSDAQLAGRTAAVTGASRGIGLATAAILAQSGARVALLARSASDLQQHAERLGNGAFAVPCDLLDEAQLAAAIDSVVDAFQGAPDVLVLNAG